MKVFVDTVAWVALLNRDDNLHDRAREVLQQLYADRVHLYTTELVLIEVANLLAAPGRRTGAFHFIQSLKREPVVTIAGADEDLLSESWQLFGTRDDKAWSMVDCVSFVVMQREGIFTAFTADHHFRQAGYVTLL